MTTELNTRQLILVANHVLRRLAREGDQADRQAHFTATSVGFVRPSTDASVSGSRSSSVVERTAASRELADVRRWEEAKQRLAWALAAVDQAITNLVPADEAEWHQPGSGTCVACDRWVSGAEGDRIRSGMCDSCRSWVRREMDRTAGERGDAINARRRFLAEREERSA